MIQSCRDKRTRDFAAGKRVKEFSGSSHAARMKIGPDGSRDFGERPFGVAGEPF